MYESDKKRYNFILWFLFFFFLLIWFKPHPPLFGHIYNCIHDCIILTFANASSIIQDVHDVFYSSNHSNFKCSYASHDILMQIVQYRLDRITCTSYRYWRDIKCNRVFDYRTLYNVWARLEKLINIAQLIFANIISLYRESWKIRACTRGHVNTSLTKHISLGIYYIILTIFRGFFTYNNTNDDYCTAAEDFRKN